MVSMQWVSAMYTVQDKTESGPSQCRGLELSMASHLRVFLERATFFLGFGFTEQKHAGVEEVQRKHGQYDHGAIKNVYSDTVSELRDMNRPRVRTEVHLCRDDAPRPAVGELDRAVDGTVPRRQ